MEILKERSVNTFTGGESVSFSHNGKMYYADKSPVFGVGQETMIFAYVSEDIDWSDLYCDRTGKDLMECVNEFCKELDDKKLQEDTMLNTDVCKTELEKEGKLELTVCIDFRYKECYDEKYVLNLVNNDFQIKMKGFLDFAKKHDLMYHITDISIK